MNRIRCYVRRLAGLLAGQAGILLALSAGAPAAFAMRPPPAGGGGRGSPGVRSGASVTAHIHTAVSGGMPGWQIALIAIGAALAAAIFAVLLDRAVTARRRVSPTAV